MANRADHTTSPFTICRDEDCPQCGWPETFTEIDPAGPYPIAVGCRQCGWRSELVPVSPD